MQKKVSLTRCKNYDLKSVKSALTTSIANLGGLEPYIKKGQKVLLKTNLLMKKRPEEAVTTHPIFVQALAEILIAYGCQVLIGDSPGGPFSEKILTSIYKVTGMESIAEKTGASLNYNVKFDEKENPKGFMLKRLTVTDMLNDVDCVISVSKLKTHGMMTFTGAVKNMFGIVPGIMKAEYHLNMPDYDNFADAMVDICLFANPVLSFMDGIVGMEGDGPSSGDLREVNVVIASESPYHLDKVACQIIQLDFSRVPTIRRCMARKLCSDGLVDIALPGGSIKDFTVEPFKIPATKKINPTKNMPKFINSFLNQFLQPRPVFNYKTCIGCVICAQNCPAKVIKMANNKPVVDLSGCIRCYCCQELCPQKAVDIHRPASLNLIVGKK